jgi:hypothetical protein
MELGSRRAGNRACQSGARAGRSGRLRRARRDGSVPGLSLGRCRLDPGQLPGQGRFATVRASPPTSEEAWRLVQLRFVSVKAWRPRSLTSNVELRAPSRLCESGTPSPFTERYDGSDRASTSTARLAGVPRTFGSHLLDVVARVKFLKTDVGTHGDRTEEGAGNDARSLRGGPALTIERAERALETLTTEFRRLGPQLADSSASKSGPSETLPCAGSDQSTAREQTV